MNEKGSIQRDVRAPRLAFGVMLAAVFMVLADVFITTIATQAIQQDLNADTLHLQLTLALYNISYGALLLGGARLGERFGQKRMFLLGSVMFCVATVVCATAPTGDVLVLGRLLQGIGPALLMPQVFTFIQDQFTGPQRLKAFAAFSVVSGVAAAGSQVLGGALIDLNLFGMGWRTVFWINIPVMAIVIGLSTVLLPRREEKQSQVRIDGAGLAAVTFLLLMVASTISFAEHFPLAAIVAAALAGAGLVMTRMTLRSAQRSGREPILDMGLIGRPQFRRLLAASVTYYAGNAITFSLLPMYLIGARGFSAMTAGLFFVALAGTFAVVSAVLPRITPRHPRQIARVGAVSLLISYFLVAMILATTEQTPAVILVVFLMLLGAAMGCTAPALNTLATSAAPAGSTASASGLITTSLEIGYGLGATIGVGSYMTAIEYGVEPSRALALAIGVAIALSAILLAMVSSTRFERRVRNSRAA